MEEYEKILKDDAGNPVFAEYASQLIENSQLDKAMEVCLAGLSANPECHKGRLLLARVFYEKRYIPFCVRELKELQRKLPENKAIAKLVQKFVPESASVEASAEEKDNQEDSKEGQEAHLKKGENDGTVGDETVAEVEIDFDVLDDIEEKDKN